MIQINKRWIRDPKPERLKSVQEQQLNSHTIKAMITYNCIMRHMDPIEKAMSKRIRTIPYAWSKWRCARAMLQSVLDDLLYTIPENKYAALACEMLRTRIEYRQGAAASFKQDTDMIVPTKDAIALCYYAHEYTCKLCVKDNCAGCSLAHALDHCVTLDRGNQSWNQVDITKRYEDIADGCE